MFLVWHSGPGTSEVAGSGIAEYELRATGRPYKGGPPAWAPLVEQIYRRLSH